MGDKDISKVAAKIVKKLKSKDDNDKLAALAYLTKTFPSPSDLANSEYKDQIWESLRSTQFLERALRSDETQNLVFMILSVFSHFCPPTDLNPFVPLLSEKIKDNYECEASQCLIEIFQNIDDASILFEYNKISKQSLPFFVQCLTNAQKCQMTSSVFHARSTIFKLLQDINEDLNVRKLLFLLISYLVRANDKFAIYSSKSKINLSPFLAAERLALIEVRLQLDVPLNYKEIEENERKKEEIEKKEIEIEKKKMEKKHPHSYEDFNDNDEDESDIYIGKNSDSKSTEKVQPKFTQNIGPLINPEMSAASCQLLEYLVVPLLNHEEELNDKEVQDYFKSLDSIIDDTVAIFDAVNGQRDCERKELKCLISIFASWLRDAPFICENITILKSLKNIIAMLWWFPSEALQCIPALASWADCEKAKPLMKVGFSQLEKKMNEIANEEEKSEIARISSIIYK